MKVDEINYKMHPQPSSLRNALVAAKKVGLESKTVLDPFCGTGTTLIAAIRADAKKTIGSDIEDWSKYLRRELRELIKYQLFKCKIELHWHIDAFEAVRHFEHDVLFCDPPGPWDVLGGTQLSVKRDCGYSGAELRRLWLAKLDENNWIGKGQKTVARIYKLLKYELDQGKKVVVNLFPQRGKSLQVLKAVLELRPLYANWFEVVEVVR